LKRLGVNPESNDNASVATSSNAESNIAETDANPVEEIENTDADSSNIWLNEQTEDVEKTREKEFEEYLADLLM
jgi:hypothetical protein